MKNEELKLYYRDYYKKHRAELLSKAKIDYYQNKKKIGKCKMCGKKLPKELPGNTKYCDKCLFSKGHGPDAHRMAAVRWFRKKHLDKENENK